jgi:hypothetical protein
LPLDRVPPGYREQQERNYQSNLSRLARHLAEFRKRRGQRGRRTLDDHAIQIVLEEWAPKARYGPSSESFTLDERGRLIATMAVEENLDPMKARKELERLKRNSYPKRKYARGKRRT